MKELILIISLLLPGAGPEIDLSLEKAKIIALENNPDIKLQKKNVEISNALITKEKGIYDPLLNFEIGYSNAEIPTASTFIESGTINEDIFDLSGGINGRLPTGTSYNLFELGISRLDTDSPLESLSPNYETSLSFSIAQDLLKDFGVGINNTQIEVARDNKNISSYELENVVSEILLNVEREYWLVIASKKNLELDMKAYDLALDLERRNKIQVDVGVLPKVSITQAKSEVAARQVDLINGENELIKSEDLLKNRLALDLQTRLNFIDEPDIEDVNLDEEQILFTSFQNRPELKQAELEIKKSERLKDFFSNQRLPKLSVEARYRLRGLGGDANPNELVFSDTPSDISSQFDDASDAFDSISDFDFPTWSLLGVLSFPIFNNAAKGDFIRSKAELDRNIIDYKKTKDRIALEVRDAIREVRNSKRRVDASSISVELAGEVLMNEEEKFKVGLATTRDLLEAQRDLIDAQAAQINAIVDYEISLAELERAKGTILENNNVLIEQEEFLDGY